MSRTMSTVCSISTRHSSCPLGQTGRTSIDILCHDASNNLCPSSRLDTPALPLHGSSFRNGVRFSVHTTSPGRTPCRRWSWLEEAWSPAGSNDTTGLVVRVESMKLRDAQNKPDKDCVNVIHLEKALHDISTPVLLENSCRTSAHTCLRLGHQSMPRSLLQLLPPSRHSTALFPSSLHPSDR